MLYQTTVKTLPVAKWAGYSFPVPHPRAPSKVYNLGDYRDGIISPPHCCQGRFSTSKPHLIIIVVGGVIQIYFVSQIFSSATTTEHADI